MSKVGKEVGSENTFVIMFEKNVDKLKHELVVVEKELGKKSIAAAELCHRIGLELCSEGLTDEAEPYLRRAFEIVRKRASSRLPTSDWDD